MTTLKQKLLFKKLMESYGSSGGIDKKLSVSKAMEGIYADSSTKNPQLVTQSKGWEQLLEKKIKDKKLIRVLDEGLDATKIHTSHTEPDKIVKDHPTRHKFLETALEIKGRKKPLEVDIRELSLIRIDV